MTCLPYRRRARSWTGIDEQGLFVGMVEGELTNGVLGRPRPPTHSSSTTPRSPTRAGRLAPTCEGTPAEGHTDLGAAQEGVRPGHRGAARHRIRRPRRGGHLDSRRTPPRRDRPPARLPDRDRTPARQQLRTAGGPRGAGAGGRGAGDAAGDRPPHRGRARAGGQAAAVLGVGPAAAEGHGQAHRGPGPLKAGRDRTRRSRAAAVAPVLPADRPGGPGAPRVRVRGHHRGEGRQHGRRAGEGRPPLLGAAPVRDLPPGDHREGLRPGGARRRHHPGAGSGSEPTMP